MGDHDSLLRFMFEDLGVRGELVRLDASWQAVLERHDYPDAVQAQLGQALAAAVLLSATVKFQGALILQAQGDGPLHTLVAQATHQRTLRGLARWRGDAPGHGDLTAVFGTGRLVLTLQTEGAEPYQGIVELEGGNLAEAIQNYFTRSEQLPTRLWLVADGNRACGLLLQDLPKQSGVGDAGEGWSRIEMLANTLTDKELLLLPAQTLLYRLFNEEQVRVFEEEPVSFRCACSRERIESMLRSMGEAEVAAGIDENNGILEVGCEFCNRRYHFDAVDAKALFVADVAHQQSKSLH